MSGDQSIPDKVSTYVNLNVGQETLVTSLSFAGGTSTLSMLANSQHWNSPSYVESDSALERNLSKDVMIDEPEHIQKLCTQETARLNRLRNQEHSLIYRLPPELLVEVLLLAVKWHRWSVEKLRALARVSTSWRDNILSCNRFWSVMDVLASEQARRIAMKRNPEGPVDLWCMGSPSISALESFMNDVEAINQTRLRSVIWQDNQWTIEFMKWLQGQEAAFIDILIANGDLDGRITHVPVPSEGPTLRHIDIQAATFPWQSPRLTNLRTISLANLTWRVPQINHLYAILSSSPELERLSLFRVAAPDGESPGSLPAAARPIELPVLKTLGFSLSDTIAQEIIPLIRASACRTVIVEGSLDMAVVPQELIMQLIAKPITLSNTLTLKRWNINGTSIQIRSRPAVSSTWGYWARDRPGVDVKIAVPSARVLSMLWNWLDSALRSHGGTTPITSLDVEWTGYFLFPFFDVEQFPFPFILLEHCPALTHLQLRENSGTILHPLIQFLGANGMTERGVNLESRFQLPNLRSLHLFTETIPNLEDCVSDTKDMLERRYPPSTDGVNADEALPDLCLPSALVDALQQLGVSTSLDFGKQIRKQEPPSERHWLNG